MALRGVTIPMLALAGSIVIGGCASSPYPSVEFPAGLNLPEALQQLLREGRSAEAIAHMQQLQAQQLREQSVLEREFERDRAAQHEYVYPLGRPLFQESLPIYTHEPSGSWEGLRSEAMAQRMREQREVHAAGGDPPRLIEVRRRMLADREREYGVAHAEVAQAAADLGEALAEGGELAAAEAMLRRALTVAEAAGGADAPAVALALDRLAGFRVAQGAPGEAQPLYARALAIREQPGKGSARMIAASLNNLGVVADALGDRAGAQSFYARALARQQARGARTEPIDEDDFGLKQDAAVILSNAGVSAWKDGAAEQAFEWFRRSRETHSLLRWLGFERLAEAQQLVLMGLLSDEIETLIALEHGHLRHRADAARLSLGGVLEHKGRALESFARTMSLARHAAVQRPDAGSLPIPGGGTIPIPAFAGPDATPAARARMLAELDAVRSRLAFLKLTGARDASPEALRSEVEALERQERSLVARVTRSVEESELQQRFDALARETLDEATTPAAGGRVGNAQDAAAINALPIPDRAMEMVPGYVASRVGVAIVEKVQQALPPDAVLVEFATYRPFDPKAQGAARWRARRYAAYVLLPTGAPRSVDLGEAAAIESTVAEFRRSLGDPRRAGVTSIARRLDAQIMQPVRALLGATKHIL
ncbi:MAG: tetratricopeptide repeat protein, partial [Betaproteobacteria bacterium]|nr:tetratricopeptide repeat protein [Betaproteobacteria bacterium]